MLALAAGVTPLILGILLVGLVLAILQGALQIEDGALAMTAKLLVVLLLAAGGVGAMFYIMVGLAHDWIARAPHLINRHWS